MVPAQTNQGISHQAVIRDTANEPVVNSPIAIRDAQFAGHAEKFSGLDALLARIEAL